MRTYSEGCDCDGHEELERVVGEPHGFLRSSVLASHELQEGEAGEDHEEAGVVLKRFVTGVGNKVELLEIKEEIEY